MNFDPIKIEEEIKMLRDSANAITEKIEPYIQQRGTYITRQSKLQQILDSIQELCQHTECTKYAEGRSRWEICDDCGHQKSLNYI